MNYVSYFAVLTTGMCIGWVAALIVTGRIQ